MAVTSRQHAGKPVSAVIPALRGTGADQLKGGNGVDFERKFRDPNGIVLDISHRGWVGIAPDAH